MNASTTTTRSPWPIAIASFFIVFGLFITSFIVWAVGQKQDLVTENYYEQEVRYQEQIDRVNRTRLEAAATAVKFDAASKSLWLTLPAAQAAAKGEIHFYRPSDARLDHRLPVNLNADGTQQIDVGRLATGLWKIRVAWSANGQDYYFDQQVIVN